ncbi:MAG TPA: hypothetical protein VJN70_10760 [Gemmatimonadaceae bacterium]|nr:hypothetical protein [Gemmatimonadaceae bacterium]
MTSAFAWAATVRQFRILPFLAITATIARAQDSTSTPSCDGKTVHVIHVNAHRPPFKGEIAYWQRVARKVGLHHTTTDTVIIRRFLVLETGDKCSDFRVRESARLLRAQPYLTDVKVRAIPDDSGGVTIDVETTDEISVVASASAGAGRLSYVEIGNENMFGQARLLAVHGANGQVEGRSAGFRATDYQFLKKPYQLDVEADWGQHASSWLIDAFHGYLTNLQRIAWEVGIARTSPGLVELSRGEDLDDLALQFRSIGADIGGIVKLGNLRTPFLIGGVVTLVRREVVGGLAVTDHGLVPDTTLLSSYPRVSRARFAGIAAWRNLNFITVTGFNSLAGTEDVPTGAQLFGQLGRGTHSLSGASDVYTLGDVLAGVGSGKSYAELHLISEGRRQLGIPRWDGIVSTGLLAVYLKPTELNLLRGWIGFSGGWRVQTPFQLGLNEDSQRLIGYHGALFGGRRIAAGLLARHIIPGITPRGDVAFGAFVNAARLWAGDAPFGMSTPILPSAGVSIFAATPKGSQRTLRIDFGSALRTGLARSGWEVRLIYSDFTRTALTEPGDILGAREQLIGPNVFRP